jgi:hypothetical protein
LFLISNKIDICICSFRIIIANYHVKTSGSRTAAQWFAKSQRFEGETVLGSIYGEERASGGFVGSVSVLITAVRGFTESVL